MGCCSVKILFTWWLVSLRIDAQQPKSYKAVKSCLLPWRTGKLGWQQHMRRGWNKWGAKGTAAARRVCSLHHCLPPSKRAGWLTAEMSPLGWLKGWGSRPGGHAGGCRHAQTMLGKPWVWGEGVRQAESTEDAGKGGTTSESPKRSSPPAKCSVSSTPSRSEGKREYAGKSREQM